MNIVSVNQSNVHLLRNFIENIGEASKTFRYFNHRSVDVIKNHLVTLLAIENNAPIAYGHLEPEKETIWLGICVLPEFSGRKYGSKIMIALIEEAGKCGLDFIALNVDKDNFPAINLYKKFDFKRIEIYENSDKYVLKIVNKDFVSGSK